MKPRRGQVDLAEMAITDMLRGEASERSPLAKPGRGKLWAREFFRWRAERVEAGWPMDLAHSTAMSMTDRCFMVQP